MSEDQLQSLLSKLKEDQDLAQKLKLATDFDQALALIRSAGFEVKKADLLRYQARQTLEMSDAELEGVAGGANVCGTVLCILALSIGGCDGTD